MADEQKKSTKKADVAKASGEKAEAKKATKKAAKKESKGAKKPAAKKDSKAKGKEKKADAKKASKPKKETAKKAKKAAPKAPAAPPVVKASARYVRIAPRKVRLIADQVRGMHIEKARALLQFSPRGAALPIHKLIDSAAANAENNHDLIGDEMRVASITVDEGPTLRRFRPRAMGRATPINKRTSHIRVALTPVED
ncbi:MAG: 50S ribosomal protein L22 [Solirubrobacterales bacterium]